MCSVKLWKHLKQCPFGVSFAWLTIDARSAIIHADTCLFLVSLKVPWGLWNICSQARTVKFNHPNNTEFRKLFRAKSSLHEIPPLKNCFSASKRFFKGLVLSSIKSAGRSFFLSSGLLLGHLILALTLAVGLKPSKSHFIHLKMNKRFLLKKFWSLNYITTSYL